MIKFDDEKVLLLHQLVIESSGGSAGVRDENLLNSALNSAFATFNGEDLYPTKIEKAARICFSIINNHPFVDGNKRIGILAMLSFLEINGIKILVADDEIEKIGVAIASGELQYLELVKWLKLHC